MDRNYYANKDCDWVRVSLSARRAWIEIASGTLSDTSDVVALRKESVDRNIRIMNVSSGLSTSLSARRAWIEISVCSS